MCDSSVLITHSSLKYSVQGDYGDNLFWPLRCLELFSPSGSIGEPVPALRLLLEENKGKTLEVPTFPEGHGTV